jgi:osmotically inducible protein OsmC
VACTGKLNGQFFYNRTGAFEMPTRTAEGTWQGGLKDGKGNIKVKSGAFEAGYSFSTRFEDAPGTNPEELLGAAHAACFSMALSALLEAGGHKATRVHTIANVTIDQVPDGFSITKIVLNADATVPGIEDAAFQKTVDQAKGFCPVSKALKATPIEVNVKLVK